MKDPSNNSFPLPEELKQPSTSIKHSILILPIVFLKCWVCSDFHKSFPGIEGVFWNPQHALPTQTREQRCTSEEKDNALSYENMWYCCFHTSQTLMQHHSISQHKNFHSYMLARVKQESHGREVTLNSFLTPSTTQLKPCTHRNILGHREKHYWYETPRHRLQKFNTECLISAQIHYSHLTITTQTTSKGSLTKQQVHGRSVCLLSRVSHQGNNSIWFWFCFSFFF